VRSDQLQERSARANSSSSSSSVLLLLLCDTESLLWRDSCECTPPPLDRERESGGRAALARSWRPGRARSRDRDRDRESWQCGTAHLVQVNVALCLAPKERSAGRLAQFENDGSGCRASRLSFLIRPRHTRCLCLSPTDYISYWEKHKSRLCLGSPHLFADR
jgi:hypothetical protein